MKMIVLTRGMATMVDDEDYPVLNQHKWYAHRCPSGRKVSFYAVRREAKTRRLILMHTQILGLGCRELADHRDGNTLNNMRENLRGCSHGQNLCNTGKRNQATSSRFKGVSFYRQTNRWEAYIQARGKRQRLGYFRTEAKAAAAYNFAAMHHYGQFARLNQP